jgi:lipoic acid synthetase
MNTTSTAPRKPSWLKKKIDLKSCRRVKTLLKRFRLNTVCEEALCPNISECFGAGVATFLILGKRCTRNCGFCAIAKGIPEPVDYGEPGRVAGAVAALGLRHVVVTSVTRDDLPDGGAEIFAAAIREIKKLDKDIKVEVLVPDFKGRAKSIKEVLDSRCDIFAHNVETVPSLYGTVRRGADYELSLRVLETAKKIRPEINTKSGLMLGLGERKREVLDVLAGLRDAGCDFLSIGQYLAPSRLHSFVKEFVTPEEFSSYKKEALKMGFKHVESAPYVRSSYMACRYTA